MIELFELSIRANIEYDKLNDFLAEVLRIDRSQIVSDTTFWDCVETSHEKIVGVQVYHSDLGFKTLCKWRQTWNLTDIELFQMAAYASVKFHSEVAIGNFIDPPDESGEQFIVITPARQFYRAFSSTNTEVFDTASVDGELFDVDMHIKRARTAKLDQP